MRDIRLRGYLLSAALVVLATIGAIAYLAGNIARIKEALPLASLHKERDFSVLLLDIARLDALLGIAVHAPDQEHLDETRFALDLAALRLRDNRALYAGIDADIDRLHTELEQAIAALDTRLAVPVPARDELQASLEQFRAVRASLQAFNDSIFQTSMAQISEQREYLSGLRNSMSVLIVLAGLGGLTLTLLLLRLKRSLQILKQQGDELRVREDSLVAAKEAAEAANLAKSSFLATMSHEIRTPLNGVLGMAQLLLMPKIDETERMEYARTILNSGQTLLTLLNDILDLSKVEAGKLELRLAAFAPRQVIDEIVTLFSEAARSKGLELAADWRGAEERRYRADPVRLRQMLANLVSNAIKFTPRGFVRVEAAEVGTDGEHAVLEFSVTDSGIGIAADKLALLFKPFSQVDASTTRQHGGTGLGLSIVRNLAQLMDGDAGIESAPGQGARFWFRIRAEVLSADSDSRRMPRGDACAPT